ncbi:MAG: hypothetical protein ABI383_11065, partial [Acidobacteriaceae bacterium]
NVVVRAIKIGAASATPKTSNGYQATPLCIKNSVCVIGGRFDGDSSHTFASFEAEPAPILAASATTAYIGVPDTIRSGMQHLLLVQAPKLIAFPVCIAELTIGSYAAPDTTYQKTLGSIKLLNAGDLPDTQWRAGVFPSSNLRWAQELVPGFRPSTGASRDRDKGRDKDKVKNEDEDKNNNDTEKDEPNHGQEGMVLVVLQNMTPKLASLHGSGKESRSFAFRLTDESFSQGEFVYKFEVDAAEAGKYTLQGTAIPFLAPVAGDELRAPRQD